MDEKNTADSEQQITKDEWPYPLFSEMSRRKKTELIGACIILFAWAVIDSIFGIRILFGLIGLVGGMAAWLMIHNRGCERRERARISRSTSKMAAAVYWTEIFGGHAGSIATIFIYLFAGKRFSLLKSSQGIMFNRIMAAVFFVITAALMITSRPWPADPEKEENNNG